MDAIGSISGMQSALLGQQIDVAVARKALDAAEVQGQAVVSMLEDALQLQQQMVSDQASGIAPHVSRALDVLA